LRSCSSSLRSFALNALASATARACLYVRTTAAPQSGKGHSRPARFTQVAIDCSEQPNSSAKSTIRRPFAYSSAICCRNAAGYGGLVFPPMSDSSQFAS
jgi:hypothetical protein